MLVVLNKEYFTIIHSKVKNENGNENIKVHNYEIFLLFKWKISYRSWNLEIALNYGLDTKIIIECWRIKSNNNIFDNDKWNIEFVQIFMPHFKNPFNFLSNEKNDKYFSFKLKKIYFWNFIKLRELFFENEQDKHEWNEHTYKIIRQ